MTFGVSIRWCGLLIAAVLVSACDEPARRGDGIATVTDVVDGDTIDVAIGGRDERVRLIGIDTPETKKPDSPIECFGPEASAFTSDLLPAGTEVRIERDIVGRDDYGRLLGYVHRTSRRTLREPRHRRGGLRPAAHDRARTPRSPARSPGPQATRNEPTAACGPPVTDAGR